MMPVTGPTWNETTPHPQSDQVVAATIFWLLMSSCQEKPFYHKHGHAAQ